MLSMYVGKFVLTRSFNDSLILMSPHIVLPSSVFIAAHKKNKKKNKIEKHFSRTLDGLQSITHYANHSIHHLPFLESYGSKGGEDPVEPPCFGFGRSHSIFNPILFELHNSRVKKRLPDCLGSQFSIYLCYHCSSVSWSNFIY